MMTGAEIFGSRTLHGCAGIKPAAAEKQIISWFQGAVTAA